MRMRLFIIVIMLGGAGKAFAQDAPVETTAGGTETPKPTETKPDEEPAVVEEQRPGLKLPDSDRMRLTLSGVFGYGFDPGNAAAGFETQGRPGSIIVSLFGNINTRVSYSIAINPINEVATLPACTESAFFLPNDPKFLYADLYAAGQGPQIACVPGGNRRVDMYHQQAYDTLSQQGMLREAYLKFALPARLFLQIGRSIQTEGFTPEEGGSWTAKDAPMIQRINHEAFSLDLTLGARAKMKTVTVTAKASAVVGDGNADKDYAFNRWFQDAALDGNSSPGAVASVDVSHPKFTLRLSGKTNRTGSKIERYAPSYFGAGKHNDNALIVSAKYLFSEFTSVLGECARYSWGLHAPSALMVGTNPAPVKKDGCYFTLQGGARVYRGLAVGGSHTREQIGRADSLIRYLSEQGLYGVVEGKYDRMRVTRVFVDLNRQVRVGYYFNEISNPYPVVSGIHAVNGSSEMSREPLDRWGVVVSFKLH